VKHKSSILSRRKLLHGTGTILVAAVAPSWVSAKKASPPQNRSSTTYVMDELCKSMADPKSRTLPPDVTEKTKQHLLDTFAAMVSGTELPPAKVALNFARFNEGEKTATVVGSDLLCGPANAAS
jgi:hypothetical protein